MKTILILLTTFFCFASKAQQYGYSECEQPLMQTVADAKKLKLNEQCFVNLPLSNLLQHIKPEIVTVSANPSGSNVVRLGYLLFRFMTMKQADSIRIGKKVPFGLVVYVKEPFEWNVQSRPADKKFAWTKEDAERLGSLTVLYIRLLGED
ncbi:MAG: hypothetical protein EOP48_13060 [Sphingobacteriales bacterium]|nr:MAG: hypothetical protein EOP48_13060 [Sphingobacteriales bacterium]